MPERVTRDVIEQIKIAGDLDARKPKAAKRQATGKCRRSPARQQRGADDQQRRTEAEYEAPLDRLYQQRDTEASNHGS